MGISCIATCSVIPLMRRCTNICTNGRILFSVFVVRLLSRDSHPIRILLLLPSVTATEKGATEQVGVAEVDVSGYDVNGRGEAIPQSWGREQHTTNNRDDTLTPSALHSTTPHMSTLAPVSTTNQATYVAMPANTPSCVTSCNALHVKMDGVGFSHLGGHCCATVSPVGWPSNSGRRRGDRRDMGMDRTFHAERTTGIERGDQQR